MRGVALRVAANYAHRQHLKIILMLFVPGLPDLISLSFRSPLIIGDKGISETQQQSLWAPIKKH